MDLDDEDATTHTYALDAEDAEADRLQLLDDDADEGGDAVGGEVDGASRPPAYVKRTIHGTNPQFLIEKILRERIYESVYWRESCFGLNAASLLERAADLKCVGGDWGLHKPTDFICLVLKLLKLQPEDEIIVAYIRNREFKYIRALGAFYWRLTASSRQIYEELEPLLADPRKLRVRSPDGGYEISHMDEFIDQLLHEDRVFGTQLPRLLSRTVLVDTEELQPRTSPMQFFIDGDDAPEPSERIFREILDPPQDTDDEASIADSKVKVEGVGAEPWTIGVCAMDSKAKSKAMNAIRDKLHALSGCRFVDFSDDILQNRPIQEWPRCEFLIAFFSSGFPLYKAIEYYNLRRPLCVNDLCMQKLLLDRRLMLDVIHHIGVRTPRHVAVSRDGGAKLDEDARAKFCKHLKIRDFPQLVPQYADAEHVDEDTIRIGGEIFRKPFIEKPVDGEDHNIFIYYPRSAGGGVRRLFRKVHDKSSDFVPGRWEIRRTGSYIYEEFLQVDHAEDVKVYTVGPYRFHAETRRSPVVDGQVLRNNDGKELRYESQLTAEEQSIALRVCSAFDQTVCGFDMLRVNGESYVIDVNGWSFVKGNESYYNLCASTLYHIFRTIRDRSTTVFQMDERDFGSP